LNSLGSSGGPCSKRTNRRRGAPVTVLE